jgi:transposase-like protein
MHRKGEEHMPSNNSKYSEEFREQIALRILQTGQSATSLAEEMGIDTNTVCRWVRDYRRKHNMPTYAEEKGIRAKPPKDTIELKERIKDLERQIKEKNREIEKKDRELIDEREKIEILKKSLHIFMQPHE